MAPKTMIFITILLIATSAFAKCATRTISVTYKSNDGGNIEVFRMCGTRVCGPSVLTPLFLCTKIACADGSRCNTCSVTITASDLPRFSSDIVKVGSYGVKFAGESCPFLAITSDWATAGSEWYTRNGFLAGCKPRVACRTRGGRSCRGKSPFDVAVTAQACYTTLYGRGNAPNLQQCIAGNITGGVPPGEVYGVDCIARPL